MLWLVLSVGPADAWNTADHQYTLKVTQASTSHIQKSVASTSFPQDKLVFGQGGAQQARQMQRRVVQSVAKRKPYGAFTGGDASPCSCLRVPEASAGSCRQQEAEMPPGLRVQGEPSPPHPPGCLQARVRLP